MRFTLAIFTIFATITSAADANRLAYLDEVDPYYPHRTFPKLVTPQWVGEPGVDAVIILAIDDMRGHEKWEAYLRPILDRLKKIDGRAPVSIMTCKIDPDDPHLQTWLKEGVSLEVHTIDHPCPLLGKGDFAAAKSTYDRCVDQMAAIPNNKPVAFRTPCCDSLNTVSPRIFAEIINKKTDKGHFLQMDSSVFNYFTPNDPALKREWVTEGDGRSRFAKYFPADRDFVNTIEDYPYPYPIGRLCWEFPCATPSDWQAQKLHKPNNELTVRDWYACLDATVQKQGTMNFVFHPHGWIENKQIVELIDYAQATYGKRVKFLTFNEALERINKNLLGGHPLRYPKTGADNGVRLLDINGDGYQDVVIGNDKTKMCRIWDPKKQRWGETPFPFMVKECRFGIIDNSTIAMSDTPKGPRVWSSQGEKASEKWAEGLPEKLGAFRLLDLEGKGRCEIVTDDGVFHWMDVELNFGKEPKGWRPNIRGLPAGARLSDDPEVDTGLRFVDLDGDGMLDVLYSHDHEFAAYLGWRSWTIEAFRGSPLGRNPMMPIGTRGTNNGAFIKNRHIYWQNEHTDGKPDLLERCSFNDMLASIPPESKTPEQSLKLMTVRPGYKVELAAHEPLVQDPIAIAWGPDGKLWVVEMGDYPLGLDGKGKVGGKIKILESTKNDGHYDKATVFLDNIGFPTGILPWRKGVLITAAPDILYAEKNDAGVVEVKKLFTGFFPGNQQHRVNGLVWGLDNWVYCANGDSGGTITSVATGKKLDMRGRDIRIKPDTGEMESTSGQSQYNKTRDDWGNWFGANNSIPGWHVVLEDRQLARNPSFASPQAIKYLQTVNNVVYPTSRTLPRFNEPNAYNRFTSVCGIGIYRDVLFEPALQQALFLCEPVHNLVHRMVLGPDGASFVGRRAADESRSEFLSSADNWFRPVMARTGPDGALWVVDMYRAVIEHPEWIPHDIQKQLDLRAGHDMGRIYRVSRVGVEPRPIPRLDKLDAAGLVKALDTPNGWQRDMVQMLLVWNHDKKAIEPLETMTRESKNPLARMHALATLDGMNALKPAVLRAALAEELPKVLAHAVRLCENHFGDDPELGPAVLKLIGNADVALPLAGALGGWDDPRAGAGIGAILQAHADDRFVAATAMSSLTPKNFPTVAMTILGDSARRPQSAVIEGLMSFAVARGDGPTLGKLLVDAATPKDGKFTTGQFDVLSSLVDAWSRSRKSPAEMVKEGGPELQAAWAKVEAAFGQALKLAADSKAAMPDRLAAIRLLGRRPVEVPEDRTTLADLLGPQAPGEVQAAAVMAIARIGSRDTPAVLLKGWKGYSPSIRTAVLAALLDRDRWVPAVLTALEKKEVLPAEVDAAARQRLLAHIMPTVRVQAGKLLAGGSDADRDKVIATYKPALTKAGDRERGKQVFTKTCAACHKLGDIGKGLGPDLAALSDKPADYLLTNILDPNRAVEARYLAYTASTNDGRSRVGFLLSETATSLTLVSTDGQEHTILRTDLDSLVGAGKSVMPEGLEKDVSIDQMADLLAFLRSAVPAPKPKVMAGNKPELIRAADDGSLTLPATAAEVFGPSLVLEAQYKNLGFWGSTDDRAAWTIRVPRAGRFEVWLDWACPQEESGNAFIVEAGVETLTTRIEPTASWDDYKQAKIGEIKLEAGDVRFAVRPGVPLKGMLMDLRTMKLVPVKK